jgi:YgiT-type zinc finger domain-containing protein
MKPYQEGDRSAGICETCRSKVTTRMTSRHYTPAGRDVAVPDVLVAVCERCGDVVGIPHQSTLKINEYREELNRGQ